MKKLFLALAAVLYAACATDATEDVAIEAPETLKVSFEESSRIQLQNGKTVWTEGDLVSVFYKSYENMKWKFAGKTGDRTGTLLKVSGSVNEQTMDNVVVAYPYSDYYSISLSTGGLVAFLPAEQTYMADSYGIDGNIMVSQSEYKQVVLKSVCGWVKIQLTGNGEKIQSIKLKGNNGEQVAGEIYINTADATTTLASAIYSNFDNTEVGGTMLEDNTILTEVTLNCGEGVTLGKNATAFYIALPPQEFSKGLTVEVACSDGSTMTKSTEKEVVIARNTIQPMATLTYDGVVHEVFELAYTTNDGEPLDPLTTEGFGANFVENIFDPATGNGALKFDGRITTIPDKAFVACTNLTQIELTKDITAINSEAFNNCTALTVMDIPQGVKSIGNKAFYNCTSLTSVTIGDRVTSIGELAFNYCSSLTSVTIGDKVISIGEFAFYGCSSLTSVYISDLSAWCKIDFSTGDSIPMNYGAKLYLNGVELTGDITIPSDVTKIKNYTFYNFTSLTSVTIPDSVSSIGGGAFYYCTSLKEVYCKPITPPSGGSWMFSGNASDRKIYVPRTSVDAYKAASGWSSYKSDIEGYDFE